MESRIGAAIPQVYNVSTQTTWTGAGAGAAAAAAAADGTLQISLAQLCFFPEVL